MTDFETTNLRNLQNSQLYDSVLETMNGRQNLVKIDHSENEENKPCFWTFLSEVVMQQNSLGKA